MIVYYAKLPNLSILKTSVALLSNMYALISTFPLPSLSPRDLADFPGPSRPSHLDLPLLLLSETSFEARGLVLSGLAVLLYSPLEWF